ncbi:nucleoside hydrolase, partial [Xanthomonas perforans]
MTDKIPLLIDTDPGVDDALALLMAFNDTRHEVVGLTIAAGNVGLEHTVRNALKVCEIAGRTDVPVYAGCPQPLLHPSVDAAHVHGLDGFGDVGLAPAKRTAEAEHAALAILRLSHEHAGKLLLVALGPLTNLALALTLDPTLPQRVARLVVMGGALTGHGNITAAAEFNIGFDPEAAHIVFGGFPQFDVADWEATIAHGLLHRDVEQWLAADSGRARFYEEISRKTRLWSEDSRGEYWYAADALAMAFALHPEGA